MWIELQVVYSWILFPCAGSCTPLPTFCALCAPHPDKYGTWPFCEVWGRPARWIEPWRGEVRCVSNDLFACAWMRMYALCVFMWNSIVCPNSRQPNRTCLFHSIAPLLSGCMCVCAHGFNNHVCSRGALECLSNRGAKDMAWQVCAEGPSGLRSRNEQQHNALIQAWKETSEISQDPCEEGRSSGGTSTFQCAYKESHNCNCINTVMGCVTSCWVPAYQVVTDQGLL